MRASIEALIEDILAAPEQHEVSEVLLALHLADRIGMNVPHRVWDMRGFLLECLEHEPAAQEEGLIRD
jgi:hypothetical protein